MIEQIPGHRPHVWFTKSENTSSPIINFAYSPNFPLLTAAIASEYEQWVDSLGNSPSYHSPEVIRTLPKPNCSVPVFESSPHVWHLRDVETGVEFLLISDGLRKNHYKGSSIEVIDTTVTHPRDEKLTLAYGRLLKYFDQCYKNSRNSGDRLPNRRSIKAGDEVVFLYCQHIMRATCIKVNRKSVKLDVPTQGPNKPFVKLVDPNRVAHIDDEFTVVWHANRGAEGSYSIDYENYPEQNGKWTKWCNTWDYVTDLG